MKVPKTACSLRKQKNKREELFSLSKDHLSYQQNCEVVLNIKLTFACVILLASIDLIINLSFDSIDWFLFSLHAVQVILSLLTIASLYIWPLHRSLINAAGCVAINTIWAISQGNIYSADNKSPKNEKGISQSSGFAYCIGNLIIIMISNSSCFKLKISVLAINLGLFCAFSDSSLRSIQYAIIAFTVFCIRLYYQEKTTSQLTNTTKQIYSLIDALPQTFMVVQQDQTKDNITLDLLNDRARKLMKSINITTFLDLSQRLIILRKRSKELSHNENRFYHSKNTINHFDNASSKNNNNNNNAESLFYLEEPSQKSYKKRTLQTFLLEKFSELEALNLGEEIHKQSSLQSQDKKSTKTNLAGMAGVITEFTNKAAASRSLFVPSKSFINLKSFQQQKRGNKIYQQAAQKMQDIFADEEYECSLTRDPSQHEEDIEDDDDGDIRIILQIGLFNYSEQNKIILQFNQLTNYYQQSQYQQHDEEPSINLAKINDRALFYEEFCKHSLMKSTISALEVVQTLKALIGRSQMITEVELGRFITNSNIITSNLNTQINNQNSNTNIVTVDSNLSNNLRLSSNSIGAPTGSSIPTISPAPNPPKAIYCIPKRQLDTVLQLSLLASSTVSNFTNYFAVKDMHFSEINPKMFSLLQVIKNVQRIFQKTIDLQHIAFLVSSQGDTSADNPEAQQLQQIQIQPPQAESNSNLNGSNISLSNISLHVAQTGYSTNLPLISNQNQLLNILPPTGSNSNIQTIQSNLKVNKHISISNSLQNLHLQNPPGGLATTTSSTAIASATQQSQQQTQNNQAGLLTQFAGNRQSQVILDQPSNILDHSSQQQLLQYIDKPQIPPSDNHMQILKHSGNNTNNPPAGLGVPQVGGVWFMGMKGIDEIRNDESMVQHLLFNLLQNAVENTPPYGTIAIYLSHDNDELDRQCIKIRIRNQCAPDYFFPFKSQQEHEFDLGWRGMIQEFKESNKFYFGIRMVTQLASLIGPPDSIGFKDINGKEFQVEFCIWDIPIEQEQEEQFLNMKDSTSKLERFISHNHNDNDNNNGDCDNQSSVDNTKNSNSINKKHFSGKQTRQRFHSQSSYQVKMDSSDSFDKWMKIQNLEKHKTPNTIGIRNQLGLKN